jgi:hypothetical protein
MRERLRNYAQSPAPAIRPPARAPQPRNTTRYTAMGKRIAFILLGIAILVIAGGGMLLASWQIPAPTKQLEKVIPNDRFGR